MKLKLLVKECTQAFSGHHSMPFIASAAPMLTLLGVIASSPANAAGCTTYGPGNIGAVTCSATGAATVTVQPGTNITVPNTASGTSGVEAENSGSNAGAVTVNISGTTITNNNNHAPSLGINAFISNVNATGNVLVNISDSSVSLKNGTGTLANNKGHGDATTRITGNFNLTNTTDNSDSNDGVETTTQGGGTATLDMQSTGLVSVKGGNGLFIDSLKGGGNVIGDIGSGVSVKLDNTTSGANGALAPNSGIYALTQNAGTINLTTAAKVDTIGNRADGIKAVTDTGAIKVTNSGNVTTAGITSRGIEATTGSTGKPGGAITVDNSGNITTTATGTTTANASIGILASNSTDGSGASGLITVKNAGVISTAGDYADGIQAKTSSSSTGAAGGINVAQNTGDIITNGNGAYGIRAVSTGSTSGDININNSSGNITTNGATAYAIYAQTDTGNMTLTNGGEVKTTNTGAYIHGVSAKTSGTGSATITNTGNITISGSGTALREDLNGGNATINQNGGNLIVNGALGNGVAYASTTGAGKATINMNGGTVVNNSTVASGHGLEAKATGSGGTEINFNTGSVTTHGGNAIAAWDGGAGTGTAKVTTGAGTVINALGSTSAAEGIYARATNQVDIDSRSVITANAIGIEGRSTNGTLTIKQTGGSITAGAEGIHGESVGTVDITNSSAIQTSGANGYGISGTSTSNNVVIRNSNTITTTGSSANGIRARGNSGVNIENHAAIQATGINAFGISAQTSGGAGTGDIDIISTSDITSAGTAIEAIATTKGHVKVTASGDITVNGNMSIPTTIVRGITASAQGSSTANDFAYINYQGGTIKSVGSTNPFNALYASSKSSDATILAAAGSILSSPNSHAIFARTGSTSGSAHTLTPAGDVKVVFSGDSIQTAGNDAAAIWGGAVGARIGGDVNTSNVYLENEHGTISTSGNGSAGMHGKSWQGDVKLVNGGDITTQGSTLASANWTDRAAALYTWSDTGNVEVQNTGALHTNGVGSPGILAVSVSGSAKVAASGNITVADAGVAGSGSARAHGIHAKAGGTGQSVAINYDDVLGTIHVSGGSSDDYDMVGGLRADGFGSNVNATATVAHAAQIIMDGSGSAGVVVRGDGGNSGNLIANFLNGAIINNGTGNADGINAQHYGSGDLTINSYGDITINGNNGACGASQCGSEAIYASGNSDVTVNAGGTIQSLGTLANQSSGISANSFGSSKTAQVTFDDASGSVTTQAQGAIAIRARNLVGGNGQAIAEVLNAQRVTTHGDNAAAVLAEVTNDGTAKANARTNIETYGAGSVGLMASVSGIGNVSTQSQGSIITHGANAPAVLAYAANGNANIVNTAAITTSGNLSSGLFGDAVNGTVDIDNQGIINAATRAIRANSQTAKIVNSGTISTLDDFVVGGVAVNTLDLDNTGTMTGYVTLSNSTNTMTNADQWNVRHFADTNGDGVRDTLAVAVSDFGASGNNSVTNSGVIALLGDNGQATTLDSTGAYNTGYAANTMAIGGAVQGQILNVKSFTNNGTIDMGPANAAVGDVLLISGGNTPGVSGGGTYIANGGKVILDTVLNQGGANSQSDMLVVDGTQLGSRADKITVINVGGQGALSQGNGIELVRVLDKNRSAGDLFKLSGRVVSGIYEYDLFQGGVGADASDGNWYLRALTGSPTPAPRPETGVYLRNMAAASGMFMHTLHDRLGEPQYTDKYKEEENGKVSSLWVRVVGSHVDSSAGNGDIGLDTDTSLVHLGGDLARWSNDGQDRWQFGLMGAYGQSDVDASASKHLYTNSGFKRTANGSVDGYGAGAYLTWYGNKDKPTGPYVDLWGMYGWYNNKVQGNGFKEEKYDSNGWTLSAETGYAFVAHDGEKRQWMIEPQAQIAYNSYSADDHYEQQTNTRVHNDDADGVTGRLGARLYSRSKLGDNGVQPFVEANWWYNSAKNSLMFNGDTLSEDTPDSTFELKAGLQGEIAKNWQMWGHIGGRWGENNYRSYEGMVGVKYQF